MQRFKKAKGINEIATENLCHLSSLSPGICAQLCVSIYMLEKILCVPIIAVPVTEELVKQWIDSEKSIVGFSQQRKSMCSSLCRVGGNNRLLLQFHQSGTNTTFIC